MTSDAHTRGKKIHTESFLPDCSPPLVGNELVCVTEAVSTGWISSSGKYVAEFENVFAAYCGVNARTV